MEYIGEIADFENWSNEHKFITVEADNEYDALKKIADAKEDNFYLMKISLKTSETEQTVIWDFVSGFYDVEKSENLDRRKCKWCGSESAYIDIDEQCNGCWELFTRISRQPKLARHILNYVERTMKPEDQFKI